MLVEVADSSLWADRTAKRTLYADLEVGEYWIVNLVDEVIEVYPDPHLGAYRSSRLIAAWLRFD